jgi:hypothetical protein
MKCVAAIIFVSVAFVSHALAVLRPVFPAKAGPPFNNETIITENGSIQHPAKRPSGTAEIMAYSARSCSIEHDTVDWKKMQR